MYETTKTTLGVSLILGQFCEALLFKKVTDDAGKETIVDRKLPFNTRYRLERNRAPLVRDKKAFDTERVMLMARYGKANEEGTNVTIPEENKEAYNKSLQSLLAVPVEHTIIRLNPEELSTISEDVIDVSSEAWQIFVSYMTADDALLSDLSKSIDFSVLNEENNPEKVVS